MEKREVPIVVKRLEDGKMVFYERGNGGNHYDPENEDGFYSLSLGNFLGDLLGTFTDLNDFLREGEDYLALASIIEGLLQNLQHRFDLVEDFIERTLGDIELKFRSKRFTYSYPSSPEAIVFKPITSNIQNIRHRNIKAVSGAKG
jgi:hypothetical protein